MTDFVRTPQSQRNDSVRKELHDYSVRLALLEKRIRDLHDGAAATGQETSENAA